MAQLKILHWYPNFFQGGGVANAVLGLAQGQLKHGATVQVAALPVSNITGMHGTIDVLDLSFKHAIGFDAPRFRRLFLNSAQPLRFDVVHIHGEFNPDNLTVPRSFDALAVLSPHGGFHPAILSKGHRSLKKMYIVMAKHVLYRRLATFHALCPAEQVHICRVVPSARSYCAPNGPNPANQG